MTHPSTVPASREHRAAMFLRWLLAGVLLVALVAFAVDNRDDVRVGWVVGDTTAPLALVLLLTAAIGALIGWLVVHRPQHDE